MFVCLVRYKWCRYKRVKTFSATAEALYKNGVLACDTELGCRVALHKKINVCMLKIER